MLRTPLGLVLPHAPLRVCSCAMLHATPHANHVHRPGARAQAGDIRTSLGSGLLQLGISPKSMLGLYSVNCKEWVLLDAAAHAYSMTSVPLYDTLGPDAVEYICNHGELSVVGCSAAVLPTLLSCLGRCPTVKLLVRAAARGARSARACVAGRCALP